MTYTLEQFAADIRDALRADQGAAGKLKVSQLVSRSLNDPDFVATYLKDRPPNANPREVLYEDPELGFCICGHVYDSVANGSPHDHGSNWAIYGQAVGVTPMTDLRLVEKGEAPNPTLFQP